MRRLSRREFVEQAARHSAGAGLAGLLLPTLSCVPSEAGAPVPALPVDEDALTAAFDTIIPAGEGMPSASEAGALDYVRRLAQGVPDLVSTLEEALELIGTAARERSGQTFSVLSEVERIRVLERVEASAPEAFGGFTDLVYEAYYVQPAVWDLIGYEPYPTGAGGPTMEPFDEALLSRVSELGPLYEEAN